MPFYVLNAMIKHEDRNIKETQEEKKKEELPIERYCEAILNLRPTYDFSYEEALKLWKEGQKEKEDRTNAAIEQMIERVRHRVKPEGMTNKEWHREKQGNKLKAKEQGVRTRYNVIEMINLKRKIVLTG